MENANRVVIDTSAFYALISNEDRYHAQAHAVLRMLVDDEWLLATTSYVLVETQALIMRRFGFNAVQEWMASVTEGPVDIVWIDHDSHFDAWARFEERRGAGLSLVDWTVALEAQKRSASIFGIDRGFRTTGLNVLPSGI